jgi:acetate kinase
VRVLVVNAGSSSLKLSALDDRDQLIGSRELEAEGGRLEPGRLEEVLEPLRRVDAVGHRVVHGGARFRGPALLDEDTERYLSSLVDLAPLHQPPALEAVKAVRRLLPELPSVACFDTAFHAELPEAAATYAVPEDWLRTLGIRRYGFHGLSHAYAARRAAGLLGRPEAELRVVTCHLGAGCSLAAVRGGRSVDTTMGFTPLEGLVMATRSGSVDPGLLIWLQVSAGLTAGELSDALEHRSGLLGLSGTADMREVLAQAAGGDRAASLALAVYLHRLRAGIAGMASALGGLDALVFTGGVGENSAAVRQGAVAGLEFLGVRLHPGGEGARGPGDRARGARLADRTAGPWRRGPWRSGSWSLTTCSWPTGPRSCRASST